MMKPKAILMPHANIQYSQLRPELRPWVIRNCYEKLFDLVEAQGYVIAFEASGKTIDTMAEQVPEALQKLNRLIRAGQIEPVASPYIHFMLSNVPPEVCLDSLRYSLDTWEKQTGFRPAVGWNPECGWASYIPQVYREAGFQALVMDADSFLLSFPDIRQATGLRYDVEGHSNKSQLFRIEEYIRDKPEYLRYITNPSVDAGGLKLIFRSDCMANLLLWYLMGATEGMRKRPVNQDDVREMLRTWKGYAERTGSFLMPYAEDAEYIGSTAYFYVKQCNQARFFEPAPDSIRRFADIAGILREEGFELSRPSDVLQGPLLKNPYLNRIENGVAWHGGTAKAWTNTDFSRILDPVCRSVLEGIHAVERASGGRANPALRTAMHDLESAWVSDSRWPPEPTSPGRFNVQESVDDLYRANAALQKGMDAAGLSEELALYSPGLMYTQIQAAEKRLNGLHYFGE
jgi:hypothetical protein